MWRKDPQLLETGAGGAGMKVMKHTPTDHCQKCFHKHLQAKEDGVSWKNVANNGEEPHLRGM